MSSTGVRPEAVRLSPLQRHRAVAVPVFDSGHLTSPGFTISPVATSRNELPSLDTLSFTSPDSHGMRRAASAVFARAIRTLGSEKKEDVGDIAMVRRVALALSSAVCSHSSCARACRLCWEASARSRTCCRR
jgi:hypothetical protein